VAHLAGRDQVLHRAGDVLDGDVRIDAVLVKKIDVVRAEASQHRVRYALDVLGLAVEPKAFAALLEELRANSHPYAGRMRYPHPGS
jgi:hypothetical protein